MRFRKAGMNPFAAEDAYQFVYKSTCHKIHLALAYATYFSFQSFCAKTRVLRSMKSTESERNE